MQCCYWVCGSGSSVTYKQRLPNNLLYSIRVVSSDLNESTTNDYVKSTCCRPPGNINHLPGHSIRKASIVKNVSARTLRILTWDKFVCQATKGICRPEDCKSASHSRRLKDRTRTSTYVHLPETEARSVSSHRNAFFPQA